MIPSASPVQVPGGTCVVANHGGSLNRVLKWEQVTFVELESAFRKLIFAVEMCININLIYRTPIVTPSHTSIVAMLGPQPCIFRGVDHGVPTYLDDPEHAAEQFPL